MNIGVGGQYKVSFGVSKRKSGISAGIRYFHMKEFAHFRGEFKDGWKDQEGLFNASF